MALLEDVWGLAFRFLNPYSSYYSLSILLLLSLSLSVSLSLSPCFTLRDLSLRLVGQMYTPATTLGSCLPACCHSSCLDEDHVL